MIPIINAIRSSVSSIDRCVIPIFFDVFLFLKYIHKYFPLQRELKIDISDTKKTRDSGGTCYVALSYIFLEESSSANSLISLFKNTERTVLTTTTPPKIASSSKVGSTTVFSMSEAIKNSNPSKR